ncbi:hypothetical protein V5799_030034 [Amblyomma americanum]|uniref:Uncharacterized protein n=1 Tax=Amblyomma americanum TaxID=6943 RepID=A0AAQ4EPB7_AMBAM
MLRLAARSRRCDRISVVVGVAVRRQLRGTPTDHRRLVASPLYVRCRARVVTAWPSERVVPQHSGAAVCAFVICGWFV